MSVKVNADVILVCVNTITCVNLAGAEQIALIPDLPLNNSDREVVRFAIIVDASNYQHLSWSDLDDEQARTAIRMLRCQITRLNKKAA